MDIEKISRKAILKLKLKYGLPDRGFIAGGSIANLIWEMVSGNKAVVNDIDVFIIDNEEGDKSIFSFEKKELKYYESYGQISSYHKSKDSYKIHDTDNEGIFNKIKYSSKNTSPQLIIDSFDINAVMIGYSIEEDKFYWRKEFIEFLETGELRVVNPTTPAHTAIRIIKKANELNAKVDELEFKILSFFLKKKYSFMEIQRTRFLERYANMYEKYKSFLARFFEIKRDEELEKYLLESKNKEEKFYYLEPLQEYEFGELNTTTISIFNFIFYIRNVYTNPDRKVLDIWNDLHFYYNDANYLTGNEKIEDIKYLSKISKLYPKIINNLIGMKFQEQIEIVKNVMQKITSQYDYTTAIAVLENVKMNPKMKFDEDSCLILGLTVRTKVGQVTTKPELPF